MPDESQTAEDVTILVEFPDRPGVQKVNLRTISKEKLAQKSEEALNKAMDLITDMANRASELKDRIPVEFKSAEIEFSVTLDYEVGALLSKASAEGAISVTLTWERPDPKPVSTPQGQS